MPTGFDTGRYVPFDGPAPAPPAPDCWRFEPYGEPFHDAELEATWAAYVRHGVDPSSETAFRSDIGRFRAALDAVARGEVPLPDVLPLARHLAVDHPIRVVRRALHPVAFPLADEAMLARIATDISPAAGVEGPDRVLGPWAEGPLPQRALEIAIAASCFLASDELWPNPFQHWCDRRPEPAVEVRETLRALLHAPLSAWELHSEATPGDGAPGVDTRWWLRDQVGLGRRFESAPARLRQPAALGFTDAPRPGDWLLARVVSTVDGPVATLPLLVRPRDPDRLRRALPGLVDLAVLYGRISQPRAPLDALLRREGHLLARWVLEHAWAQPQ